VLYAVGSGLPWISATAAFLGTVSRSGLEGGDGIITVIIGIAIALIGVGKLVGSRAVGGKVALVLLSVLALGFAAWEISNVNERIASIDTDLGIASVGIGLWIMIVGSFVAGLGAMSLKR
jgi:hypothetical protein